MGNEGSMEVFVEGEMEKEYDKHKDEALDSQMNFWDMFKAGYDSVVNTIVRPPRQHYQLEDLGPSSFEIQNKEFTRYDFQLLNQHNLLLQCSYWDVEDWATRKEQARCIVYLHGLSGSRLEALAILGPALSRGFAVAALDFAGSGMSEGEYVSLGYHEKQDLQVLVTHLHRMNRLSSIALWGRCMGANAALMFLTECNHRIFQNLATINPTEEKVQVAQDEVTNAIIISSIKSASNENSWDTSLREGDTVKQINDIDLSACDFEQAQVLLYDTKIATCTVASERLNPSRNKNAKNEPTDSKDFVFALICDSPIVDLTTVINEMVAAARSDGFMIPSFVVSAGLVLLNSSVRNCAKFDMNDIVPSRNIQQCQVPALFMHAEADDVVQFHHSADIFAKYGSPEKQLTKLKGVHDSPRLLSDIESGMEFLRRQDKSAPVSEPKTCNDYPKWCQSLPSAHSLSFCDDAPTREHQHVSAYSIDHKRVETANGSHVVYRIRVSIRNELDDASECSAWEEAVSETGNTAQLAERRASDASDPEFVEVGGVSNAKGSKPFWKVRSPWKGKPTKENELRVENVDQNPSKTDRTFWDKLSQFRRTNSNSDVEDSTDKKENTHDALELNAVNLESLDLQCKFPGPCIPQESVKPTEGLKKSKQNIYIIERRYHELKLLLADLSNISGTVSGELQVLRTRLVYSTKFGVSRILERREVLNAVLRLLVQSSLLKLPAVQAFLDLPPDIRDEVST